MLTCSPPLPASDFTDSFASAATATAPAPAPNSNPTCVCFNLSLALSHLGPNLDASPSSPPPGPHDSTHTHPSTPDIEEKEGEGLGREKSSQKPYSPCRHQAHRNGLCAAHQAQSLVRLQMFPCDQYRLPSAWQGASSLALPLPRAGRTKAARGTVAVPKGRVLVNPLLRSA